MLHICQAQEKLRLRRNTQEPIEHIRRGPLDAGVRDARVIQSQAPADRPCAEDPRAARCLVDRGVRVDCSAAIVIWRLRQHGVRTGDGGREWVIRIRQDGFRRTCQKIMFALKNPRWIPESRARSTLSYIALDQYSL